MKIKVKCIETEEHYSSEDDTTVIPVKVIKPKPKTHLAEVIPKKSSKRRIFAILLICFSVILLIISVFFVMNWLQDNSRINDLQNEFTEVEEIEGGENVNPPEDESSDYWDFIKVPLINVDFDELLARNPDTVAWINIKSTNINYPVVQAKDNEYYLTHAFDKSNNQAGWVFADYRNDMIDFDTNTIIYGHSRYNGTMFGSLKNVLNNSWFNNLDNRVVRMSTPYANTTWQVFSVYQIEPESYYLTTNFAHDRAYQIFLNTIAGRSYHDFGAWPSVSDKVITISTCANNMYNERIVLHAKLIKIQNK